jgi:peptide deformylase
MKLIKPTYLPSNKVETWASIKDQAEELAKFIDGNDYGECKMKVFAIHHMQVCELNPFNFFVLNPEPLGAIIDELGSRFIINPVISNYLIKDPKGVPFFQKMKEGCASFPYKTQKNVDRAPMVEVKYQIPGTKGLEDKTMQVQGVVAQIFQHEIDHGHGKNIFYKCPKS